MALLFFLGYCFVILLAMSLAVIGTFAIISLFVFLFHGICKIFQLAIMLKLVITVLIAAFILAIIIL